MPLVSGTTNLAKRVPIKLKTAKAMKHAEGPIFSRTGGYVAVTANAKVQLSVPVNEPAIARMSDAKISERQSHGKGPAPIEKATIKRQSAKRQIQPFPSTDSSLFSLTA